jgi:hypothetical protein
MGTPLHCTALHCTAPHCTALHCTAPHSAALHCTALHRTALHRTALRCTALQPRPKADCTLQCVRCAARARAVRLWPVGSVGRRIPAGLVGWKSGAVQWAGRGGLPPPPGSPAGRSERCQGGLSGIIYCRVYVCSLVCDLAKPALGTLSSSTMLKGIVRTGVGDATQCSPCASRDAVVLENSLA